MGIIEFAFREGRETATAWEDSNSFREARRLQLFHHNIEIGQKYKGEFRPIAALDLKTLQVVDVFPTAYNAAQWVSDTGLSKTRNKTDTRYQLIYGNIKMQLVKCQVAYGYLWMDLPPDSTYAKKILSRKGYTAISLGEKRHTKHFTSLPSLAKFTRRSQRTTEHMMREYGSGVVIGNTQCFERQHFESLDCPSSLNLIDADSRIIEKFQNHEAAATYLNMSLHDVRCRINKKAPVSGNRFLAVHR